MKSRIITASLILLSLFTPTILADVDRTIYLVRHAEKQADGGKEPVLTLVGQQRATNIAKMLKDKNITAIYSSDYNRTRQTAQPLAQILGLTITIYDPAKLKAFAKQILSKPFSIDQGNLLIVGHSNTTPGLASFLGGEDFGEIDHSEYHRVYQLSFEAETIKSELLFSKPIQAEYLEKK